MRTVKDPELRKRELQDVAMELFAKHGYEAVSMRDIAKAARVTPGLAYHYFDSKQKLFDSALEAYAEECTRRAARVLDDGGMALDEKLDAVFDAFSQEDSFVYHGFFHMRGNRSFHDRLSMLMCERLRPHLTAALAAEARRCGKTMRDPDVLAGFLLFGNVGIMSACALPDERIASSVREYVDVLVKSQML